jgi:DNA topoisomerase-1
MEEMLDEIEFGKKNWVTVLSEFYPAFHEQVVRALADVEKVEMTQEKTGEKCPLCGEGELLIKEGRFGKFVACSLFPECKYTKNLEVVVKGNCPICGSGIVSHTSRKFKNRIFYTCDKKGTDPECKFISWDLPVEGKSCETCGSYMVWKRFRGKTYPKCGNRECPTNARKSKKTEELGDAVEPADLTESTESTESTVSAQTAKPVKAVKTAKTAKTVKTSKTVRAAKASPEQKTEE